MRKPLFRQRLDQTVPFRRRQADAESINRRLLNSTPGQIVARLASDLLLAEILLKPPCGRLIQLFDAVALGGLRSGDRGRSFNLNSDFAAEVPHRFRKTGTGDPGQEREDISSSSAAKTMKNLPAGAHVKRWTFFLMEGAEALQILARSGQTHVLTNDLCDVDPVSNLVDDIVRNQASTHGRRGSSLPTKHGGWHA